MYADSILSTSPILHALLVSIPFRRIPFQGVVASVVASHVNMTQSPNVIGLSDLAAPAEIEATKYNDEHVVGCSLPQSYNGSGLLT